MEVIEILFTVNFWAAAVRITTPLIFGVIGALLCERAGVLILGIEGIFTAGAMAGWMAVWAGADLWTGVMVAALAGAVFGFLHAILTVILGLSQHVSGIGITLLATSASYFTYRTALPDVSSPPRIVPFQPLDVPVLSDLPFIGPVLFQQTAMTILAFVLVAFCAWVLYRTPLGLAFLTRSAFDAFFIGGVLHGSICRGAFSVFSDESDGRCPTNSMMPVATSSPKQSTGSRTARNTTKVSGVEVT